MKFTKMETIMSLIYKLFFSLLIVFQVSADSSNYIWEIQTTDPDFDLQHTKISSTNHKIFLPKTGWRCEVKEIEKKDDLESRKIYCNFSILKTGTFTTYLSCSKNRPYGEQLIDLFDQRKDINFKLMISCRKKND